MSKKKHVCDSLSVLSGGRLGCIFQEGAELEGVALTLEISQFMGWGTQR